MISEMEENGTIAELKINLEKSKIITQRNNLKKIEINNKEIVWVEYEIYLGQKINLGNFNDKKVDRRVSLVWRKFWSLKKIFIGPYRISKENSIYNMRIVAVMKYGTQTWEFIKKKK